MNVHHRHYILIFFALAAFGLSAFSYVVLYRTVISQAEESSRALQEVTLQSEKKLHEQEITAIYADSETDRARVGSLLVSEQKIVEFIEAFEKVEGDSGASVDLSGITIEKPAAKSKTPFGHVSAHLDVSGSWINVMRALILVENMPYSISLNNIKIGSTGQMTPAPAGAKKGSQSPVWNMAIDIRALSTK